MTTDRIPAHAESARTFESLIDGDFPEIARVVLGFLRERFGFGLWMVTRVEGDDWIVLAAEDHGYDVRNGDVFRWSDSFCSRMVADLGPRVAPRSQEVPAYAGAPIGQQVPIEAYIGVPIDDPDGALFGTLCAIDPRPQPDALEGEQHLFELLAGLLGNILAREREADLERRRAERAEFESLSDSLTLLPNRRAWDEILEFEERRCRRYGDPATVLVIDLDDLKTINDESGHKAGDDVLLRAADVLRSVTRETDIAARLSGDEFALLAIKCGTKSAGELQERVKTGLEHANVSASVGMALRHPSKGLGSAVEHADAAMRAQKRVRKNVPSRRAA